VYKILSKLVDEYWRYIKPNQCHFWAWLKRPIFGVHDSKGSAETLVRRGGITNYRFSNISAKTYQNRLKCIEVIVCNVTVFFETQCRWKLRCNSASIWWSSSIRRQLLDRSSSPLSVSSHMYGDYKTDITFVVAQGTLLWYAINFGAFWQRQNRPPSFVALAFKNGMG